MSIGLLYTVNRCLPETILKTIYTSLSADCGDDKDTIIQ